MVGFGAEDARAILAHVQSLPWIEHADADARFWAIRIVRERVDRIMTDMGNDPLDDPLPPKSNTFHACRTHIMEAGR